MEYSSPSYAFMLTSAPRFYKERKSKNAPKRELIPSNESFSMIMFNNVSENINGNMTKQNHSQIDSDFNELTKNYNQSIYTSMSPSSPPSYSSGSPTYIINWPSLHKSFDEQNVSFIPTSNPLDFSEEIDLSIIYTSNETISSQPNKYTIDSSIVSLSLAPSSHIDNNNIDPISNTSNVTIKENGNDLDLIHDQQTINTIIPSTYIPSSYPSSMVQIQQPTIKPTYTIHWQPNHVKQVNVTVAPKEWSMTGQPSTMFPTSSEIDYNSTNYSNLNHSLEPSQYPSIYDTEFEGLNSNSTSNKTQSQFISMKDYNASILLDDVTQEIRVNVNNPDDLKNKSNNVLPIHPSNEKVDDNDSGKDDFRDIHKRRSCRKYIKMKTNSNEYIQNNKSNSTNLQSLNHEAQMKTHAIKMLEEMEVMFTFAVETRARGLDFISEIETSILDTVAFGILHCSKHSSKRRQMRVSKKASYDIVELIIPHIDGNISK